MKQKQIMNTIPATYQRCKDGNIDISISRLRYMCRKSIIPTCKIGSKYLINWLILMDYLGYDVQPQEQNTEQNQDIDEPIFTEKKLNKIRAVV